MKIILYILCFIVTIAQGFAQKEIDSLLKKANFEVYDNPKSAIQIGNQILNSKTAKQETKIEALLVISTGYSSQRNYVKALDYAVKAAKLLPSINSDSFKFVIYSRLGVQYQQLKIYDKAHSYLDKAILVSKNSKEHYNFHKLLGFNYAIRGMIYKEQMSCELAQNYFNKSLYHYSQCPKEEINDANVSVIIYNKGNCFIALNEIDSAKIAFKKSFEHADKINANSLKAFANKGLAEVNTLEGKYDAAISLLLDASKMSGDVGDLVLNQGIYKGLADNYFVKNAMEQQQFYNRKYEATTARIKQNETKTVNQFVLQINDEKHKEMEQLKSDALYYKIPLFIFIFLMILVLLFEISRYQKKSKALKIQRKKLENTL